MHSASEFKPLQNSNPEGPIMNTSNIRATAGVLLQHLQAGLSKPPFQLVHVPHERWPFPRTSSQEEAAPRRRSIRISVLDSSFNPPTLAHLALANSYRPVYKADTGSPDDDNYDAKLLLLSVRNVDKSLKPGDATYIQRLEMMDLLAKDVTPLGLSNVAIAIIDQPTFVGKSADLLRCLGDRCDKLSSSPFTRGIELTFLVGLDTLERLFSPRYYASEALMMDSLRQFFSPSGDNSYVVCARRTLSSPSSQNTLESGGETQNAPIQEFISSQRIVLIDIGENESTYSSTAVRGSIQGLGLHPESGPTWKNFVTKRVADYIASETLYIAIPREGPIALAESKE